MQTTKDGVIHMVCDICDHISEPLAEEMFEVIKIIPDQNQPTTSTLFHIHKKCWNQVITNSMFFVRILRARQEVVRILALIEQERVEMEKVGQFTKSKNQDEYIAAAKALDDLIKSVA